MDSSDSDGGFGVSSFSTAPAAASQTTEIVKRTADRHEKRRSSSGSRRRSKRRHEEKEKEKEKSKEKSKRRRTKEDEKHKRRLIESSDPWQYLATQGIATVDRRGNEVLRAFDGATRSGTPRFVRRGGRRVVGLRGGFVWAGDDSDASGLRIVLDKKQVDRPRRYGDVDWQELERQAGESVVLVGSAGAGEEQQGFVPLVGEGTERKDAGAGRYDSDVEGGHGRRRPDYKSIDGDAATREGRRRGLGDGAVDVESSAGYLCGDKVAEYEAKLASDPSDVDTWMSLVSVQEEIVKTSFGASSQHKTRRAVAETRMAIYRRALASNPLSSQLALGFLDECKEVMSSEELLSEWERTLDTFRSQPVLVMHHVRVCQGMGALFSVERMAGVYAAAIRRILRMVCDATADAGRRAELSVVALELVHGVCLMFRDAGFAERAVAVYQAVVEWYVFTPRRLWSAPASHRMRAFELFWDSGVPRIGSDGAQGWCMYSASYAQATCDLHSSAVFAKDGAVGDGLCFETPDSWADAEKQASLDTPADGSAAMATGCLSDSAIDSMDPFSVAVFEDVQPFLADIPWDPTIAQALLDRLLQFLGIVGPGTFVFTHRELRSGTADMGMAYTTAAGDDIARAVRNMPFWRSRSSEAEADRTEKQKDAQPAFPFVSVPVTADTVDISLGYAYTCPWRQPGRRAYGEMFRRIANAMLFSEELGDRGLDEAFRRLLATSLLEWSFVESVEAGKRMGRELLRRRGASLALWNTFAKMHARRGLWADARRIWARALSIKGSSLEQGDEHGWLFVLRKSWALMEALCGRGLDMCVGILGASVGEFSELADLCESRESGCVSSVDVLRAKRVVDAAAAECRATTVSCVGVAVADEVRRALLTAGLWVAYARGRDCGAVNEYYKRSVGEQAEAQRDEVTVARGEADRELLAMEVCSVYLYHAATCKVYRAGDLRLHLTQSVSRYVHNTAFWQMLVAMESQTRMSIHVYRHLMTVLGDHRTADLYMLGVYCQQNENSARWLLRRFSQDRWAAQSVSLWTVYVMFELECGHLKRAKKAVLSALLHCPWAKPLYLLCLGACALAEQFTSDEKVMLVRGMVNAGLRSYNLLRQ